MKKISQKQVKKYSKAQYFFWLWSGAEISILKDCPTDYNRQAGIGFTIFMTTMLAFCSGSYAGWYFGDSYITAFVFGIIWSALIFSIDRSMVITLKKNPDASKQNFWLAFSSRAVLAVLIAFIISIPLELLIFQEEIQANLLQYKEEQTGRLVDITGKNGELGEKKQQYARDSSDLSDAKILINQAEPQNDTTYNLLKSNYNKLIEKYNELQAEYNKAHNRSISAYNDVPSSDATGDKDESSDEWSTYISLKAASNRKLSDLNSFNSQELKKAANERSDYLRNWHAQNLRRKDLADKSIAESKLAIDKVLKLQTVKAALQDSVTRNNKGFITRFMVLENLASLKSDKAHPAAVTIFLLLWLIRLLFFVIEILPTVTKIATPIGAYDLAIISNEENLELDLEERTKDYLAHQKRLRDAEDEAEQKQVKERIRIETALHKDVITKIGFVQNEVARQKIEQFKRQHLKQELLHNPKIEEVLWRQKDSPDKIEYFFKKGSNGVNDLLYFENDQFTKGVWSFNNSPDKIIIQLSNTDTEYKISELTADSLKLTENGAAEALEFEKV